MSIPYVQTDAGRKHAAPEERKDCTVIATAIVHDISYTEAHRLMARLGRRPGHGPDSGEWPYQFREALRLRSLPSVWGLTVASALSRIPPVGAFMVGVKNHVFAVLDGVVLDTAPPWPDQRVEYVLTPL